jgi:antitoxin MazE
MVQLVKIGNSQGIRIPKPLVEQAHLQNKELKLQIVDDGLLITPEKKPREGWQQAIEHILAIQGREQPDQAWLDMPLDTDEELT